MNVTYSNDLFAPGRLMDKVQQSIVHLGDMAKSRNCADMDYVNATDIPVNDLNDVSGNGDIIASAGQYKIAIGTAWRLESLSIHARAYGKVVYLDAIEGRNKEERPLITISTCTGTNKLVTIFQAVLSNNQRW
eukprot:2809727-Ditylum_brightwellii.AAC.1